jgi:histidinol-phosphate aminotransferase
MQDSEYFERTCQQVIATRTSLVKDLTSLGFEVLPSAANFIFAKHHSMQGAELTAKLRDKSIIVRHFKSPSRIAQYLRITIGTDEQSQLLIDALADILKNS